MLFQTAVTLCVVQLVDSFFFLGGGLSLAVTVNKSNSSAVMAAQ